MKNQKSAERFVDDIIKDLPLSQYTPRFREELLEHLEDGGKDLQDQENNLNQIKTKIMKKIGDKDTLTKSYVDFYRSSLSSLWPIELLIYIAFSYVPWIITYVIMFAYGSITNDSLWILKLIFIAFPFLIAYAFNRVVFNFAAKRLSPHIGDKRGRILTALSLVIVPTFYMISTISWQSPHSISALLEFLANIVLVLVPIYIANGIAFGIIPQKNKKIFTGNTKTPYLLLFIFLATLLGSIPLAQKKTNMPFLMLADTASAPWQFLDAMVSLITIPISLLYYLVSSLDPFIKLDTPTTFKILGVLLVVAAVGGIWLIITAGKAKTESNKSWKRAAGIAFVAYSAFMLLPIDKTEKTKLDWNVPTLNVTSEVEQKQQGLLYPMQQYIKQQVGTYDNDYFVFQEKNRFIIEQFSNNGFNYFSINANNIPKGQIPAITITTKQDDTKCADDNCTNELARQQAYESFLPYEGIFPQGFECPDCIKDQPNPAVYAEFRNESTSYVTDYTHLTYNKHKIFSTKEPFTNIIDIKISDNQEWAIFRIGYDVYLVDLRELK